jgi:autophagy-related protein 2
VSAASVEEHAFQRAPEIGPAPDMISDDLPTNPDYLDESFGAAAGLREVRDEDLDEFDGRDIADFDQVLGKGPLQAGVVSCVGGETIKLLRPGGLHIIENYFETIPPESAAGTTECFVFFSFVGFI